MNSSPWTLALVLVAITVVAVLLPFFFRRRWGGPGPALLAAGGMLGLCVFHLLPELSEMATRTHWMILAGALLISAVLHWTHRLAHPSEGAGEHLHMHVRAHVHTHGHEHEHHHPGAGIWNLEVMLLLLSILLHASADGVLLGLAHLFPADFENELLVFVLAHKLFEAFFVSALSLKLLPPRWNKPFLLLYILALPVSLGVVHALPMGNVNDARGLQSLSMGFVSFALGSLLGCLVWDLVVPQMREATNKLRAGAWLVGGLVLAFLLSGVLSHGHAH